MEKNSNSLKIVENGQSFRAHGLWQQTCVILTICRCRCASRSQYCHVLIHTKRFKLVLSSVYHFNASRSIQFDKMMIQLTNQSKEIKQFALQFWKSFVCLINTLLFSLTYILYWLYVNSSVCFLFFFVSLPSNGKLHSISLIEQISSVFFSLSKDIYNSSFVFVQIPEFIVGHCFFLRMHPRCVRSRWKQRQQFCNFETRGKNGPRLLNLESV